MVTRCSGCSKYPGAADGAAADRSRPTSSTSFGGPAALSMGVRLSRTALALMAGVVGYLVTILLHLAPSFAKAFDNWMISLLLWMTRGRRSAGRLLHQAEGPDRCRRTLQFAGNKRYGDVNWAGIIAFSSGTGRRLVGAGRTRSRALQGPISGLLGGADFSCCRDRRSGVVCIWLLAGEPRPPPRWPQPERRKIRARIPFEKLRAQGFSAYSRGFTTNGRLVE